MLDDISKLPYDLAVKRGDQAMTTVGVHHASYCSAGEASKAICICGAWEAAVQRDLELAEANRLGAPTNPSVRKPHPVKADAINPSHYRGHPSGVECIQITEHMSFNLGNAVKYLWRVDEKGDPVENLEKSRWYIDREIALRKTGARAALSVAEWKAQNL